MLNESCSDCIVYKNRLEEAGVESLVSFYCGAVNKVIYSNAWSIDCMNGMEKENAEEEDYV